MLKWVKSPRERALSYTSSPSVHHALSPPQTLVVSFSPFPHILLVCTLFTADICHPLPLSLFSHSTLCTQNIFPLGFSLSTSLPQAFVPLLPSVHHALFSQQIHCTCSLLPSSPPSSSPFSAISFPPPLFPSLPPPLLLSLPSLLLSSFPSPPSSLPPLFSSPHPLPFPSSPLPPLPPLLPSLLFLLLFLLPSILFLILLTFFAPQTFALPSSSPSSYLHAPVPPHNLIFSPSRPFYMQTLHH